jgi:hypothetical protein
MVRAVGSRRRRARSLSVSRVIVLSSLACPLRPRFIHWCLALTPNLSLNADVPHAGLRPGMRPPVSLYRYAP